MIGLLSDTHGHKSLVKQVASRFGKDNVDAIVHAGDITQVDDIDPLLELGPPVYMAYGNCDFRTESFRQAEQHTPLTCLGAGGIVTIKNQEFGVTHGHNHRQVQQILRQEPDYLIRGHTHERLDEQNDKTRIINPGAVKPSNSSFALLNTEKDELSFVSTQEVSESPP